MKRILIKSMIGLLVLYAGIYQSEGQGFRQRGFYLHEGWFFNYPFAVRTWQREDFANMFKLLQRMGYDQVGIWPMLEAIPMPLSTADSLALNEFRETIDDARSTPLECWIMQCPNLTPDPGIAIKPWNQRNPYPVWRIIRLDDPVQANPYLAHRTRMMSILNNADGYVTIDGDPGGYEGARPEDWLSVFLSDRAAIDRYGTHPADQKVIPWQMLPGRSHRGNWANGRINIQLADSLGLMDRSTILCYEAIEFEPTPPAAVLQLDHIRRILKEESIYAGSASGVFGNAQQPVMVLPNIFFFSRGSADLSYLDKTDEEVLKDFAVFLGGPVELLVPAWDCFRRDLDELPANLAHRLRKAEFKGEPAKFIPGGPDRYLNILADQVESRIELLKAIAKVAKSDQEAARCLANGTASLVKWWQVHRYVIGGSGDEPFSWSYVHDSQVSQLRQWCSANIKDPVTVMKKTSRILSVNGILTEAEALKRIKEVLPH